MCARKTWPAQSGALPLKQQTSNSCLCPQRETERRLRDSPGLAFSCLLASFCSLLFALPCASLLSFLLLRIRQLSRAFSPCQLRLRRRRWRQRLEHTRGASLCSARAPKAIGHLRELTLTLAPHTIAAIRVNLTTSYCLTSSRPGCPRKHPKEGFGRHGESESERPVWRRFGVLARHVTATSSRRQHHGGVSALKRHVPIAFDVSVSF